MKAIEKAELDKLLNKIIFEADYEEDATEEDLQNSMLFIKRTAEKALKILNE